MPCAFLLHRILLRICILLLFRSFSILRNLLHLIFIHLHLYTFFLGFFKFLSLSSYFAFFALFTMFSAFFFFTFFSHSSLIYSTHSSSYASFILHLCILIRIPHPFLCIHCLFFFQFLFIIPATPRFLLSFPFSFAFFGLISRLIRQPSCRATRLSTD